MRKYRSARARGQPGADRQRRDEERTRRPDERSDETDEVTRRTRRTRARTPNEDYEDTGRMGETRLNASLIAVNGKARVTIASIHPRLASEGGLSAVARRDGSSEGGI